jgi:uncharacterized repeat protein (TIGR03803 family)
MPAQTLTTLHSFDVTDGANPYAGLIQATDGNLYGTTWVGGAGANGGTVFKITPSGTLTVLYSFCSQTSCTDGMAPYAGLVQATDGNFYGTTTYGGANGDGTVFRITPSGTLTTLYSFCSQSNCTDGRGPEASLIHADDGNLYGTTTGGGTNTTDCGVLGCGTVFKITLGGTLTTLYSFCSKGACADGEFPQGGLVQATDGHLYGTTYNGGVNGMNGTVFEITTSGALTTLYSFCALSSCTDGKLPEAALVQAADGNLYGTTYQGGTNTAGCGGSGCGTVFKITTSGTLTTLYNFCSQSNCTDGGEPAAGLVQAADGNLYGTTYQEGLGYDTNGTIFKITTAGMLTTLYTFCSQSNCTDGEHSYAGLIQAIDGNLYGTTNGGGANGWGTAFSLSLSVTGPAVKLSPTSVTFAGQDTGTTSVEKTITLTNPGGAPLSIFSITVAGTDPSDFSQTNTCGTGIGVNGTCKIMVTFSPTATGVRTASVMITDNAANSSQSVPLKGTGILPVTLTPAMLAFGNVAVGTTSASKSVIVKNTSSTTLTITSISLTGADPGSYNLTNPCGSSLASEKSCTLAVTFSPASSGTLDASITLDDSASDSPQTVSINGTGVAPVTVTPGSLAFASQSVGTTSAARTVTLKNDQSTSLTGIGISYAGPNAGDFSNTTTCTSVLGAGKTCTISVKFAPSAAGAESATLVITDSASTSPQQVPLSGTGVISVTVTPRTLTFASQTVGTTSAAKTVTVKNNSTTASLTITGIALSGNDPGDFNPTNMCVSPLAPATSCTISVTFDPTATGSRTATLTVNDLNGTTNHQNVSLSGTGK